MNLFTGTQNRIGSIADKAFVAAVRFLELTNPSLPIDLELLQLGHIVQVNRDGTVTYIVGTYNRLDQIDGKLLFDELPDDYLAEVTSSALHVLAESGYDGMELRIGHINLTVAGTERAVIAYSPDVSESRGKENSRSDTERTIVGKLRKFQSDGVTPPCGVISRNGAFTGTFTAV